MNNESPKENEKDPAWNSLAGTRYDRPCPNCGSHAWKEYSSSWRQVECSKCGWPIHISTPTPGQIILIVISIMILLLFFFSPYIFDSILTYQLDKINKL